MFISESSPREEYMFFLKGDRNHHIKKLIIMNAIDDNSGRYSCG